MIQYIIAHFSFTARVSTIYTTDYVQIRFLHLNILSFGMSHRMLRVGVKSFNIIVRHIGITESLALEPAKPQRTIVFQYEQSITRRAFNTFAQFYIAVDILLIYST